MSEQYNDRLEQFVRRAVSKPDVIFQEDDWRKLKARLDAHDALQGAAKPPVGKLVTAIAVTAIAVFTGGVLVTDQFRYGADTSFHTTGNQVAGARSGNELPKAIPDESAETEPKRRGETQTSDPSAVVDGPDEIVPEEARPDFVPGATDEGTGTRGVEMVPAGFTNASAAAGRKLTDLRSVSGNRADIVKIDIVKIGSDHIFKDLSTTSERNKQRAKVKLPGAEEVKTSEAESVVSAEYVSSPMDHVASPRLSLLLSLAPDFSGTSLSRYSSPGKAFGAMLHYHVGSRLRIAAGVVRNSKQYVGDGEVYRPPTGYWEHYTNGKVPASVSGACDVLEFPIMVHYTVLNSRRHKLLTGAGTSSYVMQNESYSYFFDAPNPGAKTGWKTRNSSRFLFNMLNLTVGYERQILPGLAVGIEPYVKIPLADIGWCNLRLFSTGVSVTTRFTLLRKKTLTVANRSRSPD